MPQLVDGSVMLPTGVRLQTRSSDGEKRPFLLVHGLASNARLWEGVALQLAQAGHEVVAVDQRGHGRSDEPIDGYDTDTCATDLAALCTSLGLVGERMPIVAGQSWGGNVVLGLAAKYHAAAAIVLVDGGWLRLGGRFDTFDECWERLAPPDFSTMKWAELRDRIVNHHPSWPPESRSTPMANFIETSDGGVRAHLSREHHRSIVRSMWESDPRELYALVDVPVLLMPAADAAEPVEAHPEITEALSAIPNVDVRWYAGADHDLHAQQPARVANDLVEFAQSAGLR